ncbi:MAG: helix-turn-helix domain-containing protein, partial [Candidatus Kerfeldbacteria bacterium]|nr:helix-turn-helix domain-containing protein [Candidatus Kerfeldbacteria bacterium]
MTFYIYFTIVFKIYFSLLNIFVYFFDTRDTSLFEHFGLTDKEAALYLASLKLGAATVSELA